MAASESGYNWRVERGYVSPLRATILGEQILFVANLKRPYIEYHAPVGGDKGFHQYVVYADDFLSDSSIVHSVTQLRDEYLRLRSLTSHHFAFQLNIIESGGFCQWHTDHDPTPAESLNCGSTLLEVADPSTNLTTFVRLEAGDLLEIINPKDPSLQPPHRLMNVGATKRAALIT